MKRANIENHSLRNVCKVAYFLRPDDSTVSAATPPRAELTVSRMPPQLPPTRRSSLHVLEQLARSHVSHSGQSHRPEMRSACSAVTTFADLPDEMIGLIMQRLANSIDSIKDEGRARLLGQVQRVNKAFKEQAVELLQSSMAADGRVAISKSITHLANVNNMSDSQFLVAVEALVSNKQHIGVDLSSIASGTKRAGVIELLQQKTDLHSLDLALVRTPTMLPALLSSMTTVQERNPKLMYFYLDVSYNPLTAGDITLLSTLAGLTGINLAESNIGDQGMQAIAQLTGLTSLNLHNNQISAAGVQKLLPLDKLTILDLSNNTVGPLGMEAVVALTKLTKLNLAFTFIGEEEAKSLSSLPNLTSLNLCFNFLGDQSAISVSSLKSLTTLDISCNLITHVGAKALASLPSLSNLDLSINPLDIEGLEILATMTRLSTLSIRASEINNEGVQPLGNLTNVTKLDLSSNKIDENGVEFLTRLPKLTDLDLSENPVGNNGVRTLSVLTGLTSLKLNATGIDDECLQAIQNLKKLSVLDIENNRLSVESLQALAALTSGQPFIMNS